MAGHAGDAPKLNESSTAVFAASALKAAFAAAAFAAAAFRLMPSANRILVSLQVLRYNLVAILTLSDELKLVRNNTTKNSDFLISFTKFPSS